jgi:hypothetical protein
VSANENEHIGANKLDYLHPEKAFLKSENCGAIACVDVCAFVSISHFHDDQAKKQWHSEVVHVPNNELMRYDVVCFFSVRIRNRRH